jgi:hypothetical protein
MEQRKATQGGADGVFRQAVVLMQKTTNPLALFTYPEKDITIMGHGTIQACK